MYGTLSLLILILIPIAILTIALMIAAIVSIAKKPNIPGNSDKTVWLLIVILINIIGPIIYFAVGSSKMDENFARYTDMQEGMNL
ncbi:MAG: PLDc N-terminal domain-containing protein [Defluviitaleaceae bacterium]|nr:PLDc N-terminal domain-containing protein [Defluviitaleaceae bacterium]